jgi:hypothetical protein
MPDEATLLDFLFPPMAYSVWWVIGAVLVVLLAVGWVIGVLVWTLPVEVLRGIPVIRNLSYRVLQYKFKRSLAQVAERHRRGELETREAFHEISRIFRLFITFRTGFQAREMTVTDMANSPLAGPAVNVLTMTYPGQFDEADPRSVAPAVEAARTAVATWV